MEPVSTKLLSYQILISLADWGFLSEEKSKRHKSILKTKWLSNGTLCTFAVVSRFLFTQVLQRNASKPHKIVIFSVPSFSPKIVVWMLLFSIACISECLPEAQMTWYMMKAKGLIFWGLKTNGPVMLTQEGIVMAVSDLSPSHFIIIWRFPLELRWQ